MDRKTLTELDYYRIRDIVAGFCVSEEGTLALKSREPLTDDAEIERLKNLSREWTVYLLSTRSPVLSSWPQISPLFSILQTEGATLSQEQIYALGLFCISVATTSKALVTAQNNLKTTALADSVRVIESLEAPEHEIFRIIDKDGKLRDIPELRAIRKAISAIRRDIDTLIRSYTSDQSLSSVLESTVPVFRTDRQVLAVRANMKSRIQGIIHEVSPSGKTVYIEPDDIVRRNNDLVQEEFHLQQETRRVFRDLTARLSQYTELFIKALPVMIELDTTCAAAKWGLENSCVFALPCKANIPQNTVADEEPPLILQGRHPLLGKRAVPVDVHFMTGKRVLIITGPNTGGKTVTLKMIALFSLLNQSGFPVPAAEGTRLPIFSDVFADIGDEQSLDQSLSTFSGHMKNIAAALAGAGQHSLVLLDELGSGTDPQEGGAIAMSVLDTLLEKKAFVLVTTHHGILKNYGYTNPACINASVEFNTDTLSPTYRLLMGIPGESHALEIAAHSGLPTDVTARARSYISNEQADVSSLIKGLTAKHAELDRLQQNYRCKQSELNERKRKTDLKELQLRQKEHELKNAAHTETARFLAESRKKLENLVRTLREGEINRDKTLNVKQYIASLTDAVSEQEVQLSEEETALAEAIKKTGTTFDGQRESNKPTKKRMKNAEALRLARATSEKVIEKTRPVNVEKTADNVSSESLSFKKGATVVAGTSYRTGILISAERKDKWLVQFGNVKIVMKQKDLTLVSPSGQVNTPTITVDLADTGEEREHPVFELRLLGMREDEAIKVLEHQLDLCMIQNFRSFSIIHGKGTGILQQAVQDYLSHYVGVKDFHFAPPEDGGTGKTYVEMR